MPSVTSDITIAKPTPRSWPTGPWFPAVAFKLLPSVVLRRDSTTPAGRRQLAWLPLTEAERDDAAIDQSAGECVRGDDLHAVDVAEKPLEVDEDARANGVGLLEPGEVVDGDARAEARVVE